MIGKAGLMAILALALLLVGCGGDESDSAKQEGSGAGPAAQQLQDFGSGASDAQARQAEEALRHYLDARVGGEWQEACASLAKASRSILARLAAQSKEVPGNDCQAYIKASSETLSDAQRADLAAVTVDAVRLEGDGGYVLYTDADGEELAMPIKREVGNWKVAGGGIAAPLN